MLFTSKKKVITFTIAIILTCISVTAALANNPVKLIVNNQEITPDVPPQIIDGRVMVPVRWVSEALNAEVSWDEENNTVMISKPNAVAGVPEAEAKLYPFQEINGEYDGFILEVKGKRQYFDWKNVSNNFVPQLLFNDINQDGEKELIIILTTGTGTGFHQEAIHVINPSTFAESDVEDPADIVKQNVNTKIELNGDNVAIQIITGDEETMIHKEKGNAGFWFDNVGFRNSYHYEVVNNELLASIRAQVSPGMFVGEIQAAYVFVDDKYKAKTINFIKY